MFRLILFSLLIIFAGIVSGCDGRNDGPGYYDGSVGSGFRRAEADYKNSQNPGSTSTPIW